MMRLEIRNALTFAAAATAALIPSLAAAEELLRLGDELAAEASSSAAAVREHAVEIDVTLLATKTSTLDLRLADGEVLRARWLETERRGPGRFAWRGEIGGPAGGDVTLTVHDGHVVGRISAPSGVWVIEPRPAGGHRLVELDESRFPGCAGGVVASAGATPSAPPAGDGDAGKATKILSVLGVYTAAARNGAGGKSQIEAFLRAAIDLTNTAFQRTRVNARARLVHTALVGLPERASIGQSLGELRAAPAVQALRDRWSADLVAAIYENSDDFCGIAFLMRDPGQSFAPLAYSISLRSCAVANITFPHELGHNLGLEHNPENGGLPGQASFPWAFGHAVDGLFRTVMAVTPACPSGCVRRPNYSNPEVFLNGLPSGIPEQRHNQRALQSTARIIERFRAEPLTADFAWAQGEPRAGAPVDFEDASQGEPTGWAWDFGDGGVSADASPAHVYAAAGTYTVTLTVTNASSTETLRRELEVRDPFCIRDGATLCLAQDRFQVRVGWRDFDGEAGTGTLTPAVSSDSGLFWFFEADNWEMLIKILDGCGLNERFWVFSAATTNVEYTLRVVDTRTGFVREYFNPLGNQAPAITDVDAFATCP